MVMDIEVKKAQLILVGGRPVPNILTIIHEKPDIIIALCSKESFVDSWPGLKQAIIKIVPSITIREAEPIDAFAVDAIQQTCEGELLKYPGADWIVNVTSGTSLMTLGAYKAVENCVNTHGLSVKCWYMNTANTRVIPLIGQGTNSDIFSIDVEQYVASYNCGLQDASGTKQYRGRYLQADWMMLAQNWGKNIQEANLVKQIADEAKSSPRMCKFANLSIEMNTLIRTLAAAGLVNKLNENDTGLNFLLSEEQYKFLNGAWLELYVYQEAVSLGDFFDSVEWSKEIIDNDKKRNDKAPLTFNELDISLIYKAQLIVVECKSGKAGLEAKTLDDIINVTDALGGRFVVKILVTNQKLSDNADEKQKIAYKDFHTKAKRKGVYMVEQDQLPKIKTILEDQAKKPTYALR